MEYDRKNKRICIYVSEYRGKKGGDDEEIRKNIKKEPDLFWALAARIFLERKLRVTVTQELWNLGPEWDWKTTEWV